MGVESNESQPSELFREQLKMLLLSAGMSPPWAQHGDGLLAVKVGCSWGLPASCPVRWKFTEAVVCKQWEVEFLTSLEWMP